MEKSGKKVLCNIDDTPWMNKELIKKPRYKIFFTSVSYGMHEGRTKREMEAKAIVIKVKKKIFHSFFFSSEDEKV